MRTLTAPESDLIAAGFYGVHVKLSAKNGSGTWKELTNLDSRNWLEALTIDHDIDQPISQLTLHLIRDDSATLSLAPLREDSTLNRLDNGVDYSPLIDAGRSVKVELATVALGTSPAGSDWKLAFEGEIDSWDDDRMPMVVVVRDLGAKLADRWIESETKYTDTVTLEAAIQRVLDAGLGAGVVTLYTPVSPSFNVTPYTQKIESVMDACQALAQLPGWDVRYLWDSGTSSFRFTLKEPPRTKTTPDRTFGPSNYLTVERHRVDRTSVRNVVKVGYTDSATSARQYYTASDSTSITKYGRRFMFLEEATESPISTNAEAQAMGDAILSDLKEPKVEAAKEMHLFWPAEFGDLYRFSSNSVQHNTNQDLAITEIRHEISRVRQRTLLGVRGKPAGGYLTWIGRGSTPQHSPPIAKIKRVSSSPLAETVQYIGANSAGATGPLTMDRLLRSSYAEAEIWTTVANNSTETITITDGYARFVVLRVTDSSGLESRAYYTVGEQLPGKGLMFGTFDARPQVPWPQDIIRGDEGTPFNPYITSPIYDRTGATPIYDPTLKRIYVDLYGTNLSTKLIDATSRKVKFGLDLDSGVRAEGDVVFGSSGIRYPVTRHPEILLAPFDDDPINFGVDYEIAPEVAFLPTKWSLPAVFSTGDIIEIFPTDITVAGCRTRCALVQSGQTVTPRTRDPSTTLANAEAGTTVASVTLDADLEAAYWGLSTLANAEMTTYTVHYDVDTTGESVGGLLRVHVYKQAAGTGEPNILVGSRSYDQGGSWTDEQIPFADGLGANYELKIVMDRPTGWTVATVTAKACTWDMLSAPTEGTLLNVDGSQHMTVMARELG